MQWRGTAQYRIVHFKKRLNAALDVQSIHYEEEINFMNAGLVVMIFTGNIKGQ